jgi:DNA-binding MarR family transcriptional regulator
MGYRVKVLSMLLGRSLQQRLEPYGLTGFHWLVLNCLWREDGLPVSTIGEKLQQVGGTMTGVLDRMEQRELIIRERDPQDRRVWRTWLTAKGKELGKELPPIIRKNRESLYDGITQAEYDLFMSVLERLIVNAKGLLEPEDS